jgi:glycosyltransferase involved in cell wall biosynthesis
MEKITFVIPSRNNLEFLQLAYSSIRNLETKHEILVLNDASTDNTQEWIQHQNDPNLITYHNQGPERIGIVGMFDKGIEMARTDIIMAFHADMVACKDLDKNILKYLQKGTVVSATRVEPPLHPEGPEKIVKNFGIEVEEFDLNTWLKESEYLKKNIITEGIFAPWCMYKEDFLAVGGHDKLFAPQSKEDSDLFNRFQLSGYKFVQSWDALVYHFTSRGSRFNKHSGGAAGKNSNEWLYTTTKNGRNFIRKWGHFVKHDPLMKPIIPPKYDIGIEVLYSTLELLETLEPWCSTILIDDEMQVHTTHYLDKEQKNTIIDLSKKIKTTPFSTLENEIIVKIDKNTFTPHDFQIIQRLPEIIKDSGEKGKFELGNLFITIKEINEYQNVLINPKN